MMENPGFSSGVGSALGGSGVPGPGHAAPPPGSGFPPSSMAMIPPPLMGQVCVKRGREGGREGGGGGWREGGRDGWMDDIYGLFYGTGKFFWFCCVLCVRSWAVF